MPHPRLSVSSICSWNLPLEGDVALWSDLGLTHVGLVEPKLEAFGWEAANDLVRRHRLRVSSVSCVRSGTAGTLEFCPTVGADVLHLVAGGYGTIPWDDAAALFCREMGPLASRATQLGVTLALEPTNPLRSDTSFVHSVRDAVDLARRCGTGVVVDLYVAWYERDLMRVLRENVDLLALVQVCDYKLGTFDMPNRSVVGDGDLPIERLLSSILEVGYRGQFEIEILGPRIEEEGYRSSIARSVERTSDLLERLGA